MVTKYKFTKVERYIKDNEDSFVNHLEYVQSQQRGIYDLADYIAGIFCIPTEYIFAKTRLTEVVTARQIFSTALYRSGLGFTLDYIGSILNMEAMDHTTIIHNAQVIDNYHFTKHENYSIYKQCLEYYKLSFADKNRAELIKERYYRLNNPLGLAIRELKKREKAFNTTYQLNIDLHESGALLENGTVLFSFKDYAELNMNIVSFLVITPPLCA